MESDRWHGFICFASPLIPLVWSMLSVGMKEGRDYKKLRYTIGLQWLLALLFRHVVQKPIYRR